MDALTDILNTLKMQGEVSYHCEFSAPWGMKIGQTPVAEFHVIVRGNCWLKMFDEAEPIHLQSGDLLDFPHGHGHTLLDCPTSQILPAEEIVGSKEILHYGPVTFGNGGTPATLLCGYFKFDTHIQHPLLESLPSYIHIRGTDAIEFSLLQSTINFISFETKKQRPGHEAVIKRLVEVLFIQILRAYIAQSKMPTGILSAIADPKIGIVLNVMHQKLGQSWTLDRLAKLAGMSRSAFAMRFHELMGHTAIHYLTFCRMTQAKELLFSSSSSMSKISESVGYQSEAAFSKAFKRTLGISPGSFRRKSRLTTN